MNTKQYELSRSQASVLATNKVLRNTYLLLSMALLFSAAVAGITMALNLPYPGVLVFLVGMFGLSYLTTALRNSPWGILSVFAFTGFMGYVLGPVLNMYLSAFSNGGQIIMTALGGTGVIFLALSAYALTTRKDFSYMGGFLFVAITVAFIGGIAGIVFNIPMINLLVSGAFVLLASGYILYTTSEIIHGGETNYIMATISLFVAIFNLFVSLLRILSVLSGRD